MPLRVPYDFALQTSSCALIRLLNIVVLLSIQQSPTIFKINDAMTPRSDITYRNFQAWSITDELQSSFLIMNATDPLIPSICWTFTPVSAFIS